MSIDQCRSRGIWSPEETLSREQIQALQLQRLQETLCRVYEKVPFYRQSLQHTGIEPGDIKHLNDLSKLPFTVKDDLRDNYPLGLLAVPREQLVRYHASSGTTGKPTVVAYTKKDLEAWAELVARFCFAAGLRSDDVVQIAFGYGLFTGGFGLHYGIERVGASIIPASSGNTQRQLMLMHDLEATALVCTPSYSLYISEVLKESKWDRSEFKLRLGLFGGEGWSDGTRVEIESRLGISATDNYGLSEIIGPGVSGECSEKSGMHISEDYFIPELIDPNTEQVITEEGKKGELVLTTISKEALPVIRYRTRDICTLNYEPCPCGRTTVRMSKIQGRSDDMLIIRGVNLYPSQIEEVLMSIEGVEPHYQLVIRKEGALDHLEILVEISEKIFSDEMKQMRKTHERILHKLYSVIGITPDLKLVEPKTIERSVGKAKRVIDLR